MMSKHASFERIHEEVLKAAADRDVPNLRLLLNKTADLHYRDRSGYTALHYAALHGHEAVADALLAGADVNAQSLELGPPLCLAALGGKAQVVRLLLEKGAQVNKPGRWTGYPLHCACWSGSYDAATTLLSYGASTTAASAIWATFLEYGSSTGGGSATGQESPAKMPSESSYEICEWQPVIIAAHRRQESIVQLLITSRSPGFPINIEHRFWWSERPDEESFEDVSEGDRCDHETALMAASWKGPHTLLSKLLVAGAAVNNRDSWGRFALWMAAQSGQVANVQVLVEAGAEVNAVSNSGKSSLHVAIEDGHSTIVEYLIEQGADVDRADNNGRTACHFAAFKGNVKILELLFESKCKVLRTGQR